MNLVEKIKALFSAEEAENQKLLDAKLVDGTIIRTESDEFKPGDKLFVLTEDGQLENAPAGMHETTDGIVIVVDEEGIITEVRKPEASEVKEEEMAEVSEKEGEKTEEVEAEEETEACPEAERILALEEKVKMLEEAVSTLVSGMEKKKDEMKKIKAENESLKIKNQELSKVPATAPVKTKKFEKVESKNNTNLINKIAFLREKK